MKFFCVTNNPLAHNKLKADGIVFLEGKSYIDVLHAARNEIHMGRRLLTHPLSGSIKPNETPFKTVLLSGDCGEGLVEMFSLMLIENAIGSAEKFMVNKKPREWPEPALEDFMLIDFDLIYQAVNK